MIGLALLAAAQTVVIAAPPTQAASSATDWRCEFFDVQGTQFWLAGNFAEVPKGWDPNRAMPGKLDGNGPAQLRGAVDVMPFTTGDHVRRFYVLARDGEAGHYNLVLNLLPAETGLATLNYFRRDPANGRGTMSAYANGDCESRFAPPSNPEAVKP